MEAWKHPAPAQDYAHRVAQVRETLHTEGTEAALEMVIRHTETAYTSRAHPIHQGELPLWWRERASLEAMLGRHRDAAHNFDVAWKLLDERQIAAGGRKRPLLHSNWQLYGPSALAFVPPTHEDMLLPLLAASSRLAASDHQGAQVELRRFEGARQYQRSVDPEGLMGLEGLSWWAARILERTGDHQRMWLHEKEAKRPLSDPARPAPVVVLVHYGDGPRKEMQSLPASLGVEMVRTFEVPKRLQAFRGPRPAEMLGMAKRYSHLWFIEGSQTLGFNFTAPVLTTSKSDCEPELKVDGEPVAPEAFVGLGMVASRAWLDDRRMTVGISFLDAMARRGSENTTPVNCERNPGYCGLDSRHWGMLPGAFYGYAVSPEAKQLEMVECGRSTTVALRGDGSEGVIQLWSRGTQPKPVVLPAMEIVE